MEALGSGTLEVLKHTLVWLLLLTGLVGTFLPIVPGTAVLLAGCFVHYFLFGMEESGLTWISLVGITVLFVLSLIVDGFSGALGAKKYGASRWGVAGCLVGGLVGLFFPFPGLIVGPLVGAFVFELAFARKNLKEGGKATWGTLIGGLLGVVGKAILAFWMLGWFLLDVYFLEPGN